VLIKAIKQGQWIIIDNIEQTQMSILEILNKILEPGDYIQLQDYQQEE